MNHSLISFAFFGSGMLFQTFSYFQTFLLFFCRYASYSINYSSILLTPMVLYSKAQQAAVIGWLMSLNTFKIDNNINLLFDGRFRSNNHSNRFRYFFRDINSCSGESNLDRGAYTYLQNEIFVNTGEKFSINGKLFDLNRGYAVLITVLARKWIWKPGTLINISRVETKLLQIIKTFK